jgi:hypothetical protein
MNCSLLHRRIHLFTGALTLLLAAAGAQAQVSINQDAALNKYLYGGATGGISTRTVTCWQYTQCLSGSCTSGSVFAIPEACAQQLTEAYDPPASR